MFKLILGLWWGALVLGLATSHASETIIMPDVGSQHSVDGDHFFLQTNGGNDLDAKVCYTSDGNGNLVPLSTVTVNQGTTPWASNVTQFGSNNVITGTGTSGLGIPRVTVSNDSNILATQSGAWTTGRTWSLLNTTDSVNAVQSGAWTTGRTWSLLNTTDSVNAVQSGTWTTGRTWSLLNTTDSVNSVQSGTWTTGRTWSLLNTTDSVNSVQSGTWTVQQGTPPWSVSQSGAWTTGRTWSLSSGTDSVTSVQGTSPWVSNISQFGGSNVVTGTGASGAGVPRVTVSNDSNVLATQSGSWTVTANAGTNLNTSALALSANQTNGSQKTQIVDSSGNGISLSKQLGGVSDKQALDTHQTAMATGYYSANIDVVQTAASAANTTVWAMRNDVASTKNIYIERIYLVLNFNAATAITPTTLRYYTLRFSAATPTGGTTVAVVKQDSSDAATQVTDLRFLDTGLTTTGVSFGNKIAILACTTTQGSTSVYERDNISIKLAPGEGFAIRLDVAAVIGQSLTGEIIWSER